MQSLSVEICTAFVEVAHRQPRHLAKEESGTALLHFANIPLGTLLHVATTEGKVGWIVLMWEILVWLVTSEWGSRQAVLGLCWARRQNLTTFPKIGAR